MHEKEASNLEVKITELSMSLTDWGADKDTYTGNLRYKVGDNTLYMKVNDGFCRTVLTKAFKEVNRIIHKTGLDMVNAIIDCQNPIAEPEKKNEPQSTLNSNSNPPI
jgi:hypothetical protein